MCSQQLHQSSEGIKDSETFHHRTGHCNHIHTYLALKPGSQYVARTCDTTQHYFSDHLKTCERDVENRIMSSFVVQNKNNFYSPRQAIKMTLRQSKLVVAGPCDDTLSML